MWAQGIIKQEERLREEKHIIASVNIFVYQTPTLVSKEATWTIVYSTENVVDILETSIKLEVHFLWTGHGLLNRERERTSFKKVGRVRISSIQDTSTTELRLLGQSAR